MQRFCVRGVVRGGQVVLEIPLDVPDGTEVTVTDYDPADIEVVGPDPDDPKAREAALQSYLDMLKRRTGLSGSDGQTKIAG
jgi:hypothetical protein